MLELAGRGSRAALVEALTLGAATAETARGGAPGPVLLEAQELEGERLRAVSLSVHVGEIVGLAGLAGSGARELLLTICGAVPFSGGSLAVAGRRIRSGRPTASVAAGVAYLPGDRSLSAFPSHSVRHNVSVASLGRHALAGIVRPSSERSAVAELLDRVALRADPEAGSRRCPVATSSAPSSPAGSARVRGSSSSTTRPRASTSRPGPSYTGASASSVTRVRRSSSSPPTSRSSSTSPTACSSSTAVASPASSRAPT